MKKTPKILRTRHPLYSIWCGIIDRCENKNSFEYWKYGGMGLSFHPEWRKDVLAFAKDMGPRPSPRHTVDRYPDKNGGYVPGNVRWATPKQQGNNRRRFTTSKVKYDPPPANKAAFTKLLEVYSKSELATMAGVTRQAVNRWEEVPIRFVKRLSTASGIPVKKIHPDPYY